jgi:hypothetical protein
MRVALAFVLALAAASADGLRAAAAEDAAPSLPLRIEFTAPSSCPDGADFRRELERRSAGLRNAEAGENADVLRVDIVLGGSGVIAHLVFVDTEGRSSERSLDAPDCRAAENALALIAALAIERGHPSASPTGPAPNAEKAATPLPGTSMSPPAPPTPAPSAPPVQASSPSASPRETATPAPEARHRNAVVSFSVDADAFLALGMAPEPTVGFAALGAFGFGPIVGHGPALVRAGVASVPERAYSMTAGSASWAAIAALAQACPVSWRVFGRGRFWPCVTGEYGSVSASGPQGRNALTRPWAGAGIEARIAIPILGPLFFDASVDGVWALDRNRFDLGAALVYETPVAVARVAAGIGLTTP